MSINQLKKNMHMLKTQPFSISRYVKPLALLALLVGLSACGGSGGGSSNVSVNPNNGNSGGGTPTVSTSFKAYEGDAAPRNEDVQNFRRHLWSNIAGDDRCGSCHVIGGDASEYPFVRDDDINEAYDAAIGFVSLSSPASSRLVTKVAEGHNCWVGSATADINTCTSAITNFITAWAAASAPSSFLAALKQFAPTGNQLNDIEDGKRFPQTAPSEFTDLHGTLTTYCVACHTASSPTRQQPYFASADVQEAYEAAQTRIDINDTLNSRLYVRLNSESHNCWDDCAANSAVILSQINTLANSLTADPLEAELLAVSSKALRIDQGFVLSSGSRVEDNAIGLWTFGEGAGSVARNSAVVGGAVPDIDLILSGNIEWWTSGGVRINEGKLQATISHSENIFDRIRESGEYSIEAWVIPLNVTQGENDPASIVSYSKATDTRNFALAQRLYNYDFYNRATFAGQATDPGGSPAFATPDAQEVLQASLQHVVATYSAIDGRRIYVDGELIVEENDPALAGSLTDWLDDFSLVVGNEASNGRQWQGSVRLLAIHNVALGQDDVSTNFEIGVGEKYYLAFSIDHLTNNAGNYVVFRVEEFDNYSYLFSEPLFYNADGLTTISNLGLSGMRIGINGREADSGQAYINIDANINSATRPPYIVDLDESDNEVVENGGMQRLSSVGTIVPLELGINNDQFFLTFDNIAGISYSRPTSTFNPPVVVADNTTEQSDIGLKNFAEINASLSALTGISSAQSDVAETYEAVKQQMPIAENIGGFVSAHQMGVTQLAVKYCDVLVDQDSVGVPSFFAGFDFGAPIASAFDNATKKDQIILPLLDRLLADSLNGTDDQPNPVSPVGPVLTGAGDDARADYGSEIVLSDLIDRLVANNTASTPEIVTATCAAAFGSAMMLIQ